jgi:glutamyl-tRNA synthetase
LPSINIIRINSIDPFTEECIKPLIANICDENDIPIGKVMPAFRLALTGGGTGPDLMRIMLILGKEQVSQRLERALERI